MAQFRLVSMADLARQMEFTPSDARFAQLSAAEDLLHIVDPTKAYPLDFIVFKITGYHPKTDSSELLTGLALHHDLGLLIEKVSDGLDLQTQNLREPVLTIDNVSQKFSVTSKTIQRWRRRGLPARRFTFPDGKRRVGFFLGSVERFLGSHQQQVGSAANFSQVGEDEKNDILRRARRLAEACHCCIGEITRRIARKLHRSPLTVLHIVRKHDEENVAQAVFVSAAEPISEIDRLGILKAHRKGTDIKRLARRHCRPRSAIYRVIVDERIARLTRRKIKFIDDTLYHDEDAATTIDAIVSQQALADEPRREESRIPRDLPPYLQELYRTPLFSAAQERAMFLKFNFHKFQFISGRRRLDPEIARNRDLNIMEASLRRATETKNQIVQANLRLVVSVAKKHLRPGLSLLELISDGNITLMRAVEGFDIHRGHRFSTYATLALMKGFARSVPQMLHAQRCAGACEGVLAEVADARPARVNHRMLERDEVNQLLSQLDTRERDVLRAHFGLEEESAPATYEQVGQRMGLSKERVRQIEQSAMAKLRAMAAVNTSI